MTNRKTHYGISIKYKSLKLNELTIIILYENIKAAI